MPVIALLKRCLHGLLCLFAFLAVTPRALQAQQPALGRCGDRPTVIMGELYADNNRWCPEEILHARQIEPFAFTALEVGPDGAIYATRPLTGQVMIIRDSDGDELPDAMTTFADGLSNPNGLAFHNDHLYVSGGPHIYRIDATGQVETLVDDLPSGTGYWTGGIAIGDDDRLYVGLGAPCNSCEYSDRERGAVLSMNLSGSDRQVVASGFRNPADLAFYRGALWTVDSAPRQKNRLAVDELNRIESGGWYGFPYCLGKDTINIAGDGIDCAESFPPVMLFGGGAAPTSLAAFPHDSLPGTEDTLIVVLSGDPSQVDPVGYKVIMISFDEDTEPLGAALLIPYRVQSQRPAYLPYRGDGYFWERYIYINELGFGIYPQQPLAVAVDPRGWIYISITGGRIIALRPRSQPYPADLYPIWTPMHPDFDPALAPDSYDS